MKKIKYKGLPSYYHYRYTENGRDIMIGLNPLGKSNYDVTLWENAETYVTIRKSIRTLKASKEYVAKMLFYVFDVKEFYNENNSAN